MNRESLFPRAIQPPALAAPVRHAASPAEPLERLLAERLQRLECTEDFKVGYPGWSAPFPPALAAFFSHELNNYGDPESDPVFDWHTKDLERELVATYGDLFMAPHDGRWGWVTSGGSEGILHGVCCARSRLPGAKVYHSTAAHSSVARVARLLGLTAIAIPVDARGEMSCPALQQRLAEDGGTSAIVVASIGTTLTEAVDDVPRIRQALAHARVSAAHIHADAAFAGVPIAVAAHGRLPFGLHEDGADTLSFSGHKFLGVPFPCGMVLARDRPDACATADTQAVRMCGAPDVLTSSRSGHAALALWYQTRRFGLDGLRSLAEGCRRTARMAERLLNEAGWPAWRTRDDALTVVFRTPPPSVLAQWPMPAVDGLSHIVCTPGVTEERITRFIAALRACGTEGGRPQPPRPLRQAARQPCAGDEHFAPSASC